MGVSFEDLRNIRYNSFTGEYTPLRITGEEQTVPGSAPYIFYLNESPLQVVPSTVVVKIQGGPTLIEQSKTTVPGVNQFRLNYDAKGNGQLQVNAEHKNKIIEIDYDGLGSGLSVQTIAELISNTGNYINLNAENLTVSSQGSIVLQDRKSEGTIGGNFASGAWRTRDLNTEVADTGNHASLLANQIILKAGTYYINASLPAFAVLRHTGRLQNIDDATSILYGTTEICSSADNVSNRTVIQGVFTIASEKTLEIQHRCEATSTSGFGRSSASLFGVDYELFTTVTLIKLA